MLKITSSFGKLTEADVVFKSEKQMNEFVGLHMDAHNNTKMMRICESTSLLTQFQNIGLEVAV